MSLFDKSVIEIPCPHCGKKTKQAVGSIKDKQDFTCRHCGVVSTLDAKGLLKGLKSAEDSLASLKRTLGKFDK